MKSAKSAKSAKSKILLSGLGSVSPPPIYRRLLTEPNLVTLGAVTKTQMMGDNAHGVALDERRRHNVA
jgi:hypothetical protein